MNAKSRNRTFFASHWLILLMFLGLACGSENPGNNNLPIDTGTPPAGDTITESDAVAADTDTSTSDAVEPEDLGNQSAGLRVDFIDPPKGKTAGGETVTIYGSGFEPGSQVLFDGSAGLFVFVLGPDRINVTTPPHAPGLAHVTVVLPDEDNTAATLDDAFLYYNDVTITEITPALGPAVGGTPITVKGSGFSATSKLLLGDHMAINTEVLDDGTILALTPGGDPGPVDVFVASDTGIAKVNDGFLYTDAPIVETVIPTAGPAAGGQEITIFGAGFVEPVLVRFGMDDASGIEVVSPSLIKVITPPHAAEVVDLWITTPYGATVVEDGYLYYETLPEGMEILNVVPHMGPMLGGTKVVVTATGLGTSLDTSIRFGGVASTVLSVDPIARSAIVLTPEFDSAGLVDVMVISPSGTAVSQDDFEYTDALTVAEVEPNYGPTEGGTEVVVRGMGFTPESEVFIAALPAQNVSFVSSTELQATTPAGSPGFAKVKVAHGLVSATLDDGYFYLAGGTDIYVVTPDKGSIAGGTFIDVLGVGFESDAEVFVGDALATHITFIDPTHITARTPPGEIGTVDVRIVGTGYEATLANGFTFYDPVSLYGGTWGETVEVSLNVTVLNGGDGSPLPDVFTIVGSDPATPFQGFTNLNGQITFSGADLVGEQMISVSKEGFENNSVVAFNAENVTIFLTPVSPPSPGMPPMIIPPTVTGQVFGLGKYVVGPPGPCYQGQGSDPLHCFPCDGNDECGDQGGLCMDLGSQGNRCLMQCAADTDCPNKSVCKSFGSTMHCVPTAGTKVVICEGTKPHIFAKDLPPGNGAMVNEEDMYTILAYPGEVAIVCLGGFMDYAPEPLDPAWVLENRLQYFTPVAMGVYRNLNLVPSQFAEGIDITLDIPLSRTLKLRLDDPPLDVADYLYAFIYYDFGSDGIFRSPVAPFSWSDNTLFVEGQPAAFAGLIEDASYTILAGAFSATEDNTPYSVVLRTNVVEPEDDRMLRMSEGSWELVNTGVTRNILDAYGASPSSVFAVGTDGTIYHYNGASFSVQPSSTTNTLRSIHGTSHQDIWVAADSGHILHFDGLSWSEQESGVSNHLRAVWSAGGGEVFAAGNYAIIRRDPLSGLWSSMSGISGSWEALHGTSPTDVWLVGNVGRVYHYDGVGWTKIAAPTLKNLRDVYAFAPDDIWIVGEGGTILHWNGVEYTTHLSGTEKTLTSIYGVSNTDIYVVGARGTVLHYDGVVWAEVNAPEFDQNLNSILSFEDSSSVYTFGDHELFLAPMIPIPEMDHPTDGGFLTEDYLMWHTSVGVEPHFQLKKIAIPSMFGDIPVWTLISGGDVASVPLPDFPSIEGTPGIPQTLLKFTFWRTYKEGFDIDHFDYTDLNTLDWQAWAFDVFLFSKME